MQFDSGTPALYLRRRPDAGELLELPEEEERHARALRLRAGEEVILLDGRGARTRGVIEEIDRRKVSVRAVETALDGAEGRPYIALGIGVLSDRSRFEWIVEKGVELGAREILPMLTERSEGRLHHDRAERVAVAALKQSQRSFLPEIAPPTPFDAALERLRSYDRLFICHESAPAADSLARHLASARDAADRDAPRPAGRIGILVGPEGGFSDREVERARGASALVVSLGEARLRAETAALVALAVATSLAPAAG